MEIEPEPTMQSALLVPCLTSRKDGCGNNDEQRRKLQLQLRLRLHKYANMACLVSDIRHVITQSGFGAEVYGFLNFLDHTHLPTGHQTNLKTIWFTKSLREANPEA